MNIGYLRLSNKDSLEDNGFARQEGLLKHIKLDKVYKDVISGAKRDREGLNAMLDNLGEGDVVYVASLDRMSRSTKDLLEIVELITSKGAALVSIKDSWLDTRNDNPMSSFLLTVMGAMCQLERDMITARIQEGVKLAQERGVKFGRPVGNSKEVKKAVKMYLKGGLSMREVEKATGVSRSTISKVTKKMRELGITDVEEYEGLK